MHYTLILMRRILILVLTIGVIVLLAAIVLRTPDARFQVKNVLGLEPPPQITPLAIGAPVAAQAIMPRPLLNTLPPTQIPLAPTPSVTLAPRITSSPQATRVALSASAIATASVPTVTLAPSVTPSPAPVEVNGRVYDAYIAAALKQHQAYQYSCEFDAAWVILQTFGVDVTVDDIIGRMKIDDSIEPSFKQTENGFMIYGGDILTAYSGDYRKNFLARSTGAAMVPVFASYGLNATPVHDRAGVEAALNSGELIWMKTTVDFKPWRSATWVMPDGTIHRTVLGNDHAVVVIGYNDDAVVIRDVLGPTSTGRNRPYEYEVDWRTFLRTWEAQEYDGLAVGRG